MFKRVADYKVAEDDGEVEVALQWNTGYYEGIHGFANGIATMEGGTHVEGLQEGPDRGRQPVRPGRAVSSRKRTRTCSARTSGKA